MLRMHSDNTLIDLKKYNVKDNVIEIVLNLFEIKLQLRKNHYFYDDLKIEIKEIIQFIKILKKVYSINRIRINKAIKNSIISGIDYSKNEELINFLNEETDLIALSYNTISIIKDLFIDIDIIKDELFTD